MPSVIPTLTEVDLYMIVFSYFSRGMGDPTARPRVGPLECKCLEVVVSDVVQ